MLYLAGVSRDHRADALFNVSLVSPIFRSQRDIRTMGCIVIQPEIRDASM